MMSKVWIFRDTMPIIMVPYFTSSDKKNVRAYCTAVSLNVWSELLSSRTSFQLEDEVLDTSEP